MNRVDFLEQLRFFTQEAIQDIILPVRFQKGDLEQCFRPAEVYLMRLPDGKSAAKKAPYIIHQIITGNDVQQPGKNPSASVNVRSIFCVYSDDEQEGALLLLNLMERLRIALLRQEVIADRYQLDLQAGLETVIYPDETAPYYAGEMASTWRIPAVEREVRQWL